MSDQSSPLVPAHLVSPGVKDQRQAAFAEIFGQALEAINLAVLTDVDPMTCDARLLPYLVREFAAQAFIAPEWPEHVQRRILKNIWSLKSLHGFDAGVKLGLSLLGMNAVIEHWHQANPRRAPNTHDITFYIGEQLFPNDQTFFGQREKEAALRMIDATKRWSQETTVYVGAVLRPRPLRTAMRLRSVSLRRHRLCVTLPQA